MDALAGRPSRCLKSKINVNRAAHNVGIGLHGQGVLQDGGLVQHGHLGGQSVPLPKSMFAFSLQRLLLPEEVCATNDLLEGAENS